MQNNDSNICHPDKIEPTFVSFQFSFHPFILNQTNMRK